MKKINSLGRDVLKRSGIIIPDAPLKRKRDSSAGDKEHGAGDRRGKPELAEGKKGPVGNNAGR